MKKILTTIAFACAITNTSNTYADNTSLATLFASDWQWALSHSPEFATTLGDNRYNHKLSNTSLAASRVYNKHQQDMLREALKISRTMLSGQELISHDQFVLEKKQAIDAVTFYPYTVQPITQIDGFQITFPGVITQSPFHNAFDYHSYLARLHAIPAYVDGLIEQMQQNMNSGWMPPKVIVAPVPDQLHELRMRLDESELAKPFRHIPANVPKPAVFVQSGKRELNERVAPALLKLENFIITQYLPACRDTIAASALPGGMAYYEFLIRQQTTTNLTPEEIHRTGLAEVTRLRAAVQQVMKQIGFQGSFAEFSKFLNTDPQFFYTNPDDLLRGFRDIITRADQVLPTMFAHLPAAQVEVRPIPLPGSEQQPVASYHPGSGDDSSHGIFAVNISNLNTRAKWAMETLALHEAVPGHHLQISIAKEATDLPAFRRNGWNGWNSAFGEGWALYAESLGYEMGFYKDPYSQFGNLNDELFRAAQLVVDTGIHAMGWSREQAIAYLNENTANPPNENIIGIDRIIAWPAHALAYKIGQIKIKALRTKAAAALGDQFNLKAFHNAVLDNGPLPLSVLEAQIDLWIARQLSQKEVY